MIWWLQSLIVGDAQTSAFYSEIHSSLRERLSEWSFDRYYARHQSGLSLWTANGSLGLHVEPLDRLARKMTPPLRWRVKLYHACSEPRYRAIHEQRDRAYQEIVRALQAERKAA